MAEIEFKASEGTGWEALPRGAYNLRIVKGEARTSTKGNPQLMVECTVNDGPHESKKCTLWLPLTDKGGFRMRELLEAAIPDEYDETDTGKTTDEGTPIMKYRFDTDDLVDTVFTADCTIREYDGKDQNDFSNLRQVSGAEADDAGKDDDGGYLSGDDKSKSNGDGSTSGDDAPAGDGAPAGDPPPATSGRRRARRAST